MTNDERKLLDNILDALDRLFDTESTAVDIYVLIFATSKALSNTEYFVILDNAVNNLEEIVSSKLKADDERSEALKVTNDLRIFLAETLDYVNMRIDF